MIQDATRSVSKLSLGTKPSSGIYRPLHQGTTIQQTTASELIQWQWLLLLPRRYGKKARDHQGDS